MWNEAYNPQFDDLMFSSSCYFITIIVIWCSIQMRSAWINATRYFIAFNSLSCFSGRPPNKTELLFSCDNSGTIESNSKGEKRTHSATTTPFYNINIKFFSFPMKLIKKYTFFKGTKTKKKKKVYTKERKSSNDDRKTMTTTTTSMTTPQWHR